jgi:nitrite reductase/ring-hydroxylating ferredoxin subunit
MNWVNVLAQAELPPEAQQVVKVNQRAILLLHHGGEIYALENSCPHMKLPLKGGKVEGDAIVCPWHRSAFDLRSGEVKNWTPWPPGVGKVMAMVSKAKAVTVFPTRVEEGSIWVGLEE